MLFSKITFQIVYRYQNALMNSIGSIIKMISCGLIILSYSPKNFLGSDNQGVWKPDLKDFSVNL